MCHALSIDGGHKARDFDATEGVSCENCHGGAADWLGPHVRSSAKHEDMVRLGLVDNNNLATRTVQCLTCHLGSSVKDMQVDHEMIAAGHPDLTFELDSFTAVEPPHWIEKNKEPGVRDEGVEHRTGGATAGKHAAGFAAGAGWPLAGNFQRWTALRAITR